MGVKSQVPTYISERRKLRCIREETQWHVDILRKRERERKRNRDGRVGVREKVSDGTLHEWAN